jgi:hypothetical protein
MGWIPPIKIIDEISAENTPDKKAASGFSVSVPDTLSFRWEDLILCVGRTQMLSAAHSSLTPEERFRLVRDVSIAILTHLNIFIDASSARFVFTKLLNELADEERTSLASKAGAAIADLLMEKSGYRFRANARELDFSKLSGLASRKIPDFVYDDAKGDHATQSEVVILEAKGSLSKFLATKGRLKARALKAYNEQVRELEAQRDHDFWRLRCRFWCHSRTDDFKAHRLLLRRHRWPAEIANKIPLTRSIFVERCEISLCRGERDRANASAPSPKAATPARCVAT